MVEHIEVCEIYLRILSECVFGLYPFIVCCMGWEVFCYRCAPWKYCEIV